MTRYAVDEDRHVLTASWPCGRGDQAITVAQLPRDCAPTIAGELAHALTQLSAAAWRTYTDPVCEATDDGLNSERWRRQRARDAVDDVLTIVGSGTANPRVVHYGPVSEAARRIDLALQVLGDRTLTDAVRADIAAEVTAVTDAERGDLTGRARQAVELSRATPSPVQVAAAHDLLAADLFDTTALFTDFDPTSASVAAAEWLYAAAAVAAEVSGEPIDRVVAAADDIFALPVATPTMVLAMMDDGMPSHEVVSVLVSEARTVATAHIPDVQWLRGEIDHVYANAHLYGGTDSRLLHALLAELRLTPLDPLRPAPDLLEDLLAGIRGCWSLYRSSMACSDVDASGYDEDGEEDDDGEALADRLRQIFIDDVVTVEHRAREGQPHPTHT